MLLLANKDFQLKKKKDKPYTFTAIWLLLYPPFLLVYSTKELLIFGDIAILLHWSLTKQGIRQPDRAERGQRFRQFYLEVTLGLTASEMLAIHCCKEKLWHSVLACVKESTPTLGFYTPKKKSPYACQVLKVGKYNLRWTITHYILYLIFIYLLKTSECERKKESLPHNSTTCRTRFCSNTLNKFLCLWLLFTVLP